VLERGGSAAKANAALLDLLERGFAAIDAIYVARGGWAAR